MKIAQILIALLATTPLLANPTDPVGVVNSEIPAHDGGSATFKILSLSLLQPPVFTGSVIGVSGATLNVATDSMAGLSLNETDSFGNPIYYAEFRSGSLEGLSVPVVNNSPSSFTLSEDNSGSVNVGDMVNIRPYSTVASVFGSDNSKLSLFSSTTANFSDSLYLVQPDGSFIRVFYQNAPPFAGGIGWRSTSNATEDVSDAIIFNDTVVVGRFGPDPRTKITVPNVGDVKVVEQMNPIHPGSNTLTYAYPITRKLNELGFDPADLLQSTTANTSDNVYVVSNGQFSRYFYQNAPPFAGGIGWRSTDDSITDQGPLVTIEPGDGIIFVRRGSTPFNWTATPPPGI